ncbi:MATE family efflux transporter [Clostridia bacterium]|nr:MATE family efflux transporter [Clostridia bacterium]
MTKDMTRGNPLSLILLFSLPVLLGNLFQQFYNMADTVIVGHFLGEDALAAVGSTGSIVFLVLGFAIGISQGFGIMISHAFGAKDIPLLRHYAALSILLGAVISVIMTVITMFLSRSLLIFLKTPANILDTANSFLLIIYGGITATMFFNIASSILRGLGNSKVPLYILILSSVLNVILDFFFIGLLQTGATGAAWATVISQGVSAVLCFLYMFKRFDFFHFHKEDFRPDPSSVKHLLSIGLPTALNYSITASGMMILQSAINFFGSAAVAAYTASSKVELLAFQPMVSLGTTMATYCGQNLGAKKYQRIFDGMKQAFIITFFLTAFAVFITQGFGSAIVRLFLSHPSDIVVSYSTQYFNTISWFFLPLAWIFLYRTALQGLGKGLIPLLGGLLEMGCRFFVIVFFLKTAGYTAVCFASPAAWVGAGVPLLIVYYVWERKAKKTVSSN